MFTEAELRLYSRHIAMSGFDIDGQQKLKSSKVVILGLGGLGSPVALYLAASGVGNLTLIDHDEVSLSNLQRQILHDQNYITKTKTESAKQKLKAQNPYINIDTINKRVTKADMNHLAQSHDLVIDCSDNFETRFDLNKACVEYRTALISGAAIRWQGQVAIYNHSQNAACYHCLFEQDGTTQDNCWEQGVLSPLVGVIGSLQAVEAIKYLIGIADMKSYLIQYNARNAQFTKIKAPKDKNCQVCSAVNT